MADYLDELLRVLLLDTDGNDVNVSESFENAGFPLHDGHSSSRSDVPETENGRSVRDDRAPVGLHRHLLVEVGLRQALHCQIILDILVDKLTYLEVALGLDLRTQVHDSLEVFMQIERELSWLSVTGVVCVQTRVPAFSSDNEEILESVEQVHLSIFGVLEVLLEDMLDQGFVDLEAVVVEVR